MNADRIQLKLHKTENNGDFIVVELDGGAEYLKEFSVTSNGEEKAWQMAACYREGYLDGTRSVEGAIKSAAKQRQTALKQA